MQKALMMKFYGYDKCSTCRQAKKFFRNKNIPFEDIDITISPPSKLLLKNILTAGQYHIKDILNTSGQIYRQLNLKDKVPHMQESELLDLLSQAGKLIKRPIVTDGKRYTVGYDVKRFETVWG